jgi:hypothetical protein
MRHSEINDIYDEIQVNVDQYRNALINSIKFKGMIYIVSLNGSVDIYNMENKELKPHNHTDCHVFHVIIKDFKN